MESKGYMFLKRLGDILISAFFLILLLPVFALIALWIKLDSKGPVFFLQKRVGKGKTHFRIVKFRTMYTSAPKDMPTHLVQNSGSMITKAGRILRKTSLDELPQLWNILKGEMSLVGPRPPLPAEVCKYTLEERKRLHIKPGITCIWQISGRSDIPFKQQVKLDEQYIRSHGILKDLIILLKTIPAVITGKGAY